MILPRTFSANICSGKCGKKRLYQSTHARMKSLLRRRGRGDLERNEGSCCIATRWESVSILLRTKQGFRSRLAGQQQGHKMRMLITDCMRFFLLWRQIFFLQFLARLSRLSLREIAQCCEPHTNTYNDYSYSFDRIFNTVIPCLCICRSENLSECTFR